MAFRADPISPAWAAVVGRRVPSIDKCHRLLAGSFDWLGLSLPIANPIDWSAFRKPDIDLLWRFHLHYQDDVLTVAWHGDRPGHELAWRWIDEWIAGNPLTDGQARSDAWHPYCVSRRLCNWAGVLALFSPSNPERLGRIVDSLWQQASFLERRLEYDVGGNHLLANAKALLFAGTLLAGADAERWLQVGARILSREIPRQVLPSGEHFERSTMYHAQVLADLEDLAAILVMSAPATARLCDHTAARMRGFLSKLCHPDGGYPLFGDSVVNASLWPESGWSPAKPICATSEWVGEAWVYRERDDFLVFDTGPIGADELPAHAHSDLLTFEASRGGRKFFLDVGTPHYRDDPLRQYARSTAAHNVLQVDSAEQCDLWGRFRVGYRGKPTRRASGTFDNCHWSFAEHDAFGRVGVPVTQRFFALVANGPWVCLDRVETVGAHTLKVHLHLAADVRLADVMGNVAVLEQNGKRSRLTFIGRGTLAVGREDRYPMFGVAEPSLHLTWSVHAVGPAVVGWWLNADDGPDDSVDATQADVVRVASLSQNRCVTIRPPWRMGDRS